MPDQGLKAIFGKVRPMLLRLLVARLGDREEAEDALQDLWLRIDQLGDRPIAHGERFLYRAAANLATDRRIARLRRSVRDTAWHALNPSAGEYPDAERVMIARDRLKRVERAIAAMPARMKAALLMFRFEGRSQRDIAEQLGVTISGVEKLLRRAHRKLDDANAAADLESAAGAEAGLPRRIEDEGAPNDD